jgi:hypothetical protein
MFGKIATLGAMLALTLGTAVVPSYAKGAKVPSCCPSHPASHAKCCTSGKTEECCRVEKMPKSAVRTCAITGKPLSQCCGSKASQTPPCCQKGCKHAGHKER